MKATTIRWAVKNGSEYLTDDATYSFRLKYAKLYTSEDEAEDVACASRRDEIVIIMVTFEELL